MDRMTVVVCTYNRSESLKETLRSLHALRSNGAFTHDVVVVDNNSSDDTKRVVHDWQESFAGRLSYVFEARQGQSYARNTGVTAAQGTIVAFTDDDILVDRDWLMALHRALQDDTIDGAYGRIFPYWKAEKPPWFCEYFMRKLVLLDYGHEPFVASDENEQFIGANFAMRKHVLLSIGPFNVSLGHKGDQLGGGEDTEMFLRLLQAGRRLAYQPSATVRHTIPQERLTKSYFRKRQFEHGQSWARTRVTADQQHLAGIPTDSIKDCIVIAWNYLRAPFVSGVEDRLVLEMRLRYYWGFFSEKIRAWVR